MTPRSLFNIIIKIFGLFFLKELIGALPQLLSSFLYFDDSIMEMKNVYAILIVIIVLVFYAFLIFILLFKTDYIIDKLQLDQGFDQDTFTFDFSNSKVLYIALIIIAGILLIQEIPYLLGQLITYFQLKEFPLDVGKPDITYMVISVVKIIIALLLIGERKRIIDFIENRQSKNQIGDK